MEAFQDKNKTNTNTEVPKKKKEKKLKYQQIMKDLPATCFSCSAHQQQHLRLVPYSQSKPPTCKSCGFRLQGKFGYLACAKSSSCFHLCSTCKVCSNNHILGNVTNLTQYNLDPLYLLNKFTCRACKLIKNVDKRGVLHCGPCSFTICADCHQKTNELWQKMIRMNQQQ